MNDRETSPVLPAIEASKPHKPIMMLVLCKRRPLNALVDELEDWHIEGVKVTLYGVTEKANEGFILLRWDNPITDHFVQKMRIDDDVTDYFTVENVLPVPSPQI